MIPSSKLFIAINLYTFLLTVWLTRGGCKLGVMKPKEKFNMIQHSDRRALEQSKRALGTRKEKRKFIGEDPIKGKAPFSSYGAANQCSKSRFSTILCKTPIDNWIFQTIPDTSYHSEWNTINLTKPWLIFTKLRNFFRLQRYIHSETWQNSQIFNFFYTLQESIRSWL